MKKFLKGLFIAAIGIVFLGCNLGSGGADTTPKTLSEQINESSADVDFANQSFTEDAEVATAKTVSNLNMDGKTLTVKISGVTLKNVTVTELVAGEGIGDGELTIDGCTIEKLTVLGGGSNSINIKDAKIEEVAASKENVRLNLQGDSEIKAVSVEADSIKIESGEDVKIDTVLVGEEVKVVTVSGGEIAALEVEGTDNSSAPALLITGKTTIKEIAEEVAVKVTEEAKNEVELPETVAVIVVKLENAYLDASNTKRIYMEGDKFDYAGLLYVEEYSDGTITKKTLKADDCTVSGFDSSKEGSCTVTVTYDKYEIEYTVKIGTDKIKIDLSDKDFGGYFYKAEYKTGKYRYECNVVLNDYFEILPVKGDKIQITLKAASTFDIAALCTRLCYWDINGEYHQIGDEVECAKDVKDGIEFTATLNYELTLSPDTELVLQFSSYDCSKDSEDFPGFIENGKGLSSVGKYVKAEPCDEGIKVTMTAPEGFKHRIDNAGSISLYDGYVSLNVSGNFKADDSKEFDLIYPFVEKDKSYYLRFSGDIVNLEGENSDWKSEFVKVTAGGGRNITDYISEENKAKYDSIKTIVKYHEDENNFTYGFDSDGIEKITDIYNPNTVKSIYWYNVLCLGPLYWNTGAEWWGGNNLSVNEDGSASVIDRDYKAIDFISNAKAYTIPFMWKNGPTYEQWSKHNNTYCANLVLQFVIADYPNETFNLPDHWSELMTYDNPGTKVSAKNIDLDAAIVNGVKNVKKFVSSEDEIVDLFMEAYNEYISAFTTSTNTSRSVITVPDGKALTILDAAKQTTEVAEKMVSIIKELSSGDGKDIKIDFDDTINLGELTFSQWIDIICQTYDAINKAVYGVTSGYYAQHITFGEKPVDWYTSYTSINGVRTYYWYKNTKIEKIDTTGLPDNIYFWKNDGNYGYTNIDTWENVTIGAIPDGYTDYNITDFYENGSWVYYWYKNETKALELDDTQKALVERYNYIDWWYDTTSSTNYYYGVTTSSGSVTSSSDMLNSLKEQLKTMSVDYDTLLSTLDSFATIKNFYFDADIDVDYSYAKLTAKDTDAKTKLGSAELALLLDGGISDVNKAINWYFSTFGGIKDAAYDLPVKAIAFDVEAKVDGNLVYGDVQNNMNVSDEKTLKVENSSVDASEYVMLKASVCTAAGNGGIITVEVNTNADTSFIVDYSNAMLKLEESSISTMMEYAAKLGTIKISVSDGTKDTFAKEYTAEDLYKLFTDYMKKYSGQ